MRKPCPGLLASVLAGVLGACIAGCASPGSQPIVGPDGSPMAHVHCGSDQGLCFRIAGELCPHGYDLKPVLSGNDGNFLVRCRSPRALAQVAPACPLPATASSPAGLMYPWPPPGVSSTARSTTPANGSSGEIDLGY
jgi:hypothetical protein